MIFAILVPISALPLLFLVYFLWDPGDYLFTMLAWFVGALVILIVVYFGNILPPVPFIVLGAIGLFCAPFIGLQIRDKREQQRKLKEQEWWLLWQLERELSGIEPQPYRDVPPTPSPARCLLTISPPHNRRDDTGYIAKLGGKQ
jgi:hypothetical protein